MASWEDYSNDWKEPRPWSLVATYCALVVVLGAVLVLVLIGAAP